MSQNRIFIAVGAILLVAVALWFAWPSSASKTNNAKHATSDKDDPIELLRKSRREKGIFEVTPASVAGVVVDGNGERLAGAVVMLKSREGLSALDMDSTATPSTTIADSDGHWSFENVSSGKVRVTASAKGHLPKAPLDLYLNSGEARKDVEIVLKAGGHTLTGAISDVGGGPVALAVVVVLRSAGFDEKAYSVAKTDGTGRYEVQLATGDYTLSVTHPDYVRKTESVHLASDQVLDLSLSPAASVHGRVITSDGAPVSGAKVYASGGIGKDATDGQAPGALVATDEEGAFVMRGLRSGSYTLKAAAKGYSTVEATEIDLNIAESLTDVEVIVEPAHTISGFVVEHNNPQQGIKGVQVMAMNMGAQTFAFSFHPSGEDGYFEMPGVLPGSYMVAAYHEDLLGSFMEVNVTVVDKDIDDVLIKLKRGAVLKGRVEPAGVAEISLEVEEAGFMNMMKTMMAEATKTRSNEDGTFELKPTPSGDFILVATAKDGRRGELKINVNDANQEGLIVKLEEGLSLRGKVVDEKGKPVVAVRVVASLKEDNPHMTVVRMGGKQQAGVAVNTKGEYQIRGLQEGTHEVEVLDSRGALSWAGLQGRARYKPITVEINGDVEETLKVERADGVIRGVVLGVNGTPMVDAWVSASRGHSDALWTMTADADDLPGSKGLSDEQKEGRKEKLKEYMEERNYNPYSWGEEEDPILTDEDGRFEIRNLREGSYQITANAPEGSARVRQRDVSPGANLTLRLEEMTSLRITVTTNGVPATKYQVSLSGPSSRNKSVISETGEQLFTKLERGRYTVSASTEEVSVTEKVVIGEEPEIPLSLAMKAWCGVRGQVVDLHSKEPISGLIIWSMSGGNSGDMGQQGMDMMTGKGPTTDAEGVFEVSKLYCSDGSLSFMSASSMFGGGGGARHMSFKLETGIKDLGTVYFDSRTSASEEERGSFGLAIYSAEKEGPMTVSMLEPGGPAEIAGIAKGERVVAIGGIATEELAELVYALVAGPSVRSGEVIVFTLSSESGEIREVSLTAVPAPKLDI